MKVYIINDRDIEDLLLRIERDPTRNGHVLNATERQTKKRKNRR